MQGAGLPPELLQAIDQAAQQGPGAAAQAQPTDPNATPQGSPDAAQNPVEALKKVLAALEEYQAIEPDQVDLAEAAKVYAVIQKLLAKDQSEREAAAGVTPVHRGLAKAQAGGQQPGSAGAYG